MLKAKKGLPQGIIPSLTKLFSVTTTILLTFLTLNTIILAAPITINVSGNAYQPFSSQPSRLCSLQVSNIALRYNNKTYTTSCNPTTGSYKFTNVVATTSSTPMIIWIMGGNGALVNRYDGSGDSINNSVYENNLTVTSETSSPVVNANIDYYDSLNDSTIPYTATGTNVTLNTGMGFYTTLKSGMPNGSSVFSGGVTTADYKVGTNTTTTIMGPTVINRNLVVDASATLLLGANTSLYGNLINDATSTVKYYAISTLTVYGGTIGTGTGSVTFYNLSKEGSGEATLLGGKNSTLIYGDLSVSNGTLNQNALLNIQKNLNLSGSATLKINKNTEIHGNTLKTLDSSSIISAPNTTVSFAIPKGTTQCNIGGGNGNLSFYDLKLNIGGTTICTFTNAGTTTIANIMGVNGGTFIQNSPLKVTKQLNISNGTPTVFDQRAQLDVSGTGIWLSGLNSSNISYLHQRANITTTQLKLSFASVDYSGTPTLTIVGTGGTYIGGTINPIYNTNFYNLVISTQGTVTLDKTLTINKDLTVNSGAILSINKPITVKGSVIKNGTGTIKFLGGKIN